MRALPLPYRFEVAPCAEAVPATRREVNDVLRGWGLPEAQDAHDVLLVVSELMTNAVLHAGGALVAVCVELQPDLLRIEVYDGGDSIPAPAPARVEADRENGRGLLLVHALATTVTWAPTARGKHVVVEMARP